MREADTVLNNLINLVNSGVLANRKVIFLDYDKLIPELVRFLRSQGIEPTFIVENRIEYIGQYYCGVPFVTLGRAIEPHDPKKLALLAVHPLTNEMNDKLSLLEIFPGHSRFDLYNTLSSKQSKLIYHYGKYSVQFKKLMKRYTPIRLMWNEYKMQAIEKTLKHIVPDLSKKILIFPHPSIGDPFIISQFYAEKNPVYNDRFTLLVPSKNTEKACRLMGFQDVITVERNTLDDIIRYKEFMGESEKRIHILHFDFLNYGFLNWLASMKRYPFISCYETYIFNAKCHFVIRPKRGDSRSVADFCEEKGLKKGRSVLLVNQANSIPVHSPVLWEAIARELINNGYDVYTNCMENDPFCIYGTKALFIPLEILNEVVEYCGFIIGERCGLIDFISQSSAVKIVLHVILENATYPVAEFYNMRGYNLVNPIYEFAYPALPEIDKAVSEVTNVVCNHCYEEG